MATKYTSLVRLKKNKMLEVERELMEASKRVDEAQEKLHVAYEALNDATAISSGKMQNFLQSRALIEAQRAVIETFKHQVNEAIAKKEHYQALFKESSIEYEKFNFLELQEIKKEIARMKQKEQKDLDEMAIQTFMRHKESHNE